MKRLLILLVLALMPVEQAAAASYYNCQNAQESIVLNLRKIRDSAKESLTLKNQKTDEEKRYKEDVLEMGKERMKTENDLKKRREDLEKSIYERRTLGIEYKKKTDELKAGLYCSECRRSKSEIEKASTETFYAHIKRVKGKPQPAPPDVMLKASEEYNREWKISYKKTDDIEKSMDKMYDRLEQLNKDVDARTKNLAESKKRLDERINGCLIDEKNMAEDIERTKRAMKSNDCE